jgi:iron complex outermembrane receptor protein
MFHRVSLLCLGITISAPVPVVLAAEPAPSAIEEVLVTARYREERAQDTPLAMTAFSDLTLQKIVAQDLRDVGPSTPNLHIQPVVTFQNSAAVHIRGMGGQGIESTEENRNGISINGIFVSRPIATLIDLFDVDRIEVLRGPQGTTFGKNSLAGGINITTKRPDGAWDWQGEFTGGNYGREDYRGALEFPIVEGKLSGRVSALLQNYDGHFENRVNGDDLNGENVDTIRATLVFTPVDAFDATLIYSWLDENSTAPGGDNDPDPGQLLQFTEPDKDPFKVGRDALDFADTDQESLTLIMNWDLGSFVLTSVSGWIGTNDFIASDFDQTEIPFFPTFREQVHDQYSTELRLASDFGDQGGFLGNLDLVLGLFYFEQEHELVQSFPTLGPSADYAHQDGDSKAVFGQAIYALSDATNVTFGIRYTDEKKDFERNSGAFAPGLSAQNPGSRPRIAFMSKLPMNVTGKLDSDNTSVRLGVDHRLRDNVLAYATFAQGFKAGEFGARAASAFTVGPTDDEESDSYEIGIKSDWLDNTLRVNVAAFYTQYSNLQFGVFIPSAANPTGQETSNQNIGEATTMGLEVETVWAATDNLTLEATIGLLDAEYDKFCADLDGPSAATNPVSNCGGKVVLLPNGTYLVDVDQTDRDLSRAPKSQVYLAAEYALPTEVGTFSARIAGNFEDAYYSDGVLNRPSAETGDFWLWDSSITWRSLDESWRVQAWCKNCMDKEYVNGYTPTANFFNQRFYGNPQVYGLTLSYQR